MAMEPGAQPFDFGRKVDAHLFDRVIDDGYEVNMSDYISEAWDFFKAHAAEFSGFTLILFLLTAVLSKLDIFGSIALTAVMSPLYAGYVIVTLKKIQGEAFRFSDFFQGFNSFLPLVFAGFLAGILVTIGMVLFLLPGIYLAVGYMFTTALIVDYRMDFWQAMETSRRIVTKNWFSLFVFGLLLALINLLGVLAFGIGLLVTIPVSACAAVLAYRDIAGVHGGEWRSPD